jgi:hypothetical protein
MTVHLANVTTTVKTGKDIPEAKWNAFGGYISESRHSTVIENVFLRPYEQQC